MVDDMAKQMEAFIEEKTKYLQKVKIEVNALYSSVEINKVLLNQKKTEDEKNVQE